MPLSLSLSVEKKFGRLRKYLLFHIELEDKKCEMMCIMRAYELSHATSLRHYSKRISTTRLRKLFLPPKREELGCIRC